MPPNITVSTPWSAAFISWVMKQAEVEFPANAYHTIYAKRLVDNRVRFKFDIINPADITLIDQLRLGDVVVFNRAESRNIFQLSSLWGNTPSHGDIVVTSARGSRNLIGGNVSDKVSSRTIRTLSNAFVILRPHAPETGIRIADVAQREFNLWKSKGWVETSPGAVERIREYWRVLGVALTNPIQQQASQPAAPGVQYTTQLSTNGISTPGITPYITSLESFHPKLQYELTRRTLASEAANTYTPFVKLTSLVRVLRDNLSDDISDAWCPTLGVHGQQKTTFEEVYSITTNRSIVGYATAVTGNTLSRVPVYVANQSETSVDDASTDPPNIPSPGIVSMTTDRGTSGPMGIRGGLFKATIKIRAYSVGQLNAMLRYYLRPSTQVVLEFGRKSSNLKENDIIPFDWKQPISSTMNVNMVGSQYGKPIDTFFNDFITLREDQREFLNKYVYDNYGNYEIYIGYVANFKLNHTDAGTYDIDLTVHSVQQFEIPSKSTGVRSQCVGTQTAIIDPCKVSDVSDYFTVTEAWRKNSFTKLLALSSNNSDPRLAQYKDHIIPIQEQPSSEAGTREPEYLVSWKFFVNVILNDSEYGIMSVFQLSETERGVLDKLRSGVLQPTNDAPVVPGDNSNLIANEVGYHPFLRSVDPHTLIIYNSHAQGWFERVNDATFRTAAEVLSESEGGAVTDARVKTSIESSPVGSFSPQTTPNLSGVSSLENGVWINTAAISHAFQGSDMVSMAINQLLVAMNNATAGYWNLQLLSNDTDSPGIYVIDYGLSKPNKLEPIPTEIINLTGTRDNREAELAKFQMGSPNKSQYLYVFNKKSRQYGSQAGSELLGLNIEWDMPLMVAVQVIAGVGGQMQKSTLELVDVDELRKITLFPGIIAGCGNKNCEDLPPASTCSDTPIPSAKEDFIHNNQTLVSHLKEYSKTLGTSLTMIEMNQDKMKQQIDLDSRDSSDRPHAFNSSNLTKTVADLTFPGIGGIQLFQCFSIGRVPNVLDQGFYQVVNIAQEFTAEKGWITKIRGRFRYRPTARKLSQKAEQLQETCPDKN